jgi:hypothetical protein
MREAENPTVTRKTNVQAMCDPQAITVLQAYAA